MPKNLKDLSKKNYSTFSLSKKLKFYWSLQDNIGWTEGFGIPIGVIAVALIIFLLGIKKYWKEVPVGSPFTGVAQVFVAVARKWRVDETRHGKGVYYGVPSEGQPNTWIFARTDQFRYTKFSTPFWWCMCV